MTTATVTSEVIVETPKLTPTPFLYPTNEPDVYELHVDNSSKELFETCARAAQYYSVERREGVSDRPAQFRGTVIHLATAIRQHAKPNWDKHQLGAIVSAYKDVDFG